jgi:hypothetical protein
MSIPTPTNGQGTALVVTVSGTNVIRLGSQLIPAVASQTPAAIALPAWFGAGNSLAGSFAARPGVVDANGNTLPAGSTSGANQYGLTLSLSASGGFAATCQLTVQAYDEEGNTESDTGVNYVSYADPEFTGFSPSTASTGFPLPTNFDGSAADVSSTGLITAEAVGQAIIEVQVPFALNTLANMAGDSQDPMVRQMVYAQIVVQVIP